MAEEFLESEILFSDDSDSNLNAEFHRKSQNEVRFLYDQVDKFSGNRLHSYNKSTKREHDKEEAAEKKAKPKGTAPIQIPRKAPHDKREAEFEDWEYFLLAPHEIVAKRFANKLN